MASPPDAAELFIWRVSNYADLSGRGGLIAQGRWHSRGHPVVYCADSAEHALAEVIRHLCVPAFLIPDTYKVLRIRVPLTLQILHYEARDLPAGWDQDDYEVSQRFGDAWLRSNETPLLAVPSVVHDGLTIVINPVHRAADFIEIAEVFPAGAMAGPASS